MGLFLRAGVVALLALCVSAQAHAADPAAQSPTPVPISSPTQEPAKADGAWASARRAVREAAECLVQEVDSWFGDKPFSEGGSVTDGYLSMSLLLRQNQQPDFSLRISADLAMPNAGRFINLMVGRDNPRNLVTDKPEELVALPLPSEELAVDREFFAGVGVTVLDRIDLRLGFRGGLKPYAQARFRQAWPMGHAGELDFRETLFWSVDDLAGSTTALTYSHRLSPSLGARWLGVATITQRVSRFEWSNNFGLYQLMGPQRLLSLEALINGLQGSQVGVLDWGLQVKWEQPMGEDWLLGEVTVGHFWPRPDALTDRARAWAVGGRVTMKF